MSNTHASPGFRLLYAAMALLALVLLSTVVAANPATAHATDVDDLRQDQAFGQSMVAMGRNDTFVEYRNSAVTQYEYTKKKDGKTVDYREFCIKHNSNKATTAGGGDVDLLKIRRNYARQIDGRWADCRITITYVKFKTGSFENSTYVTFAHQSTNQFWVGTTSNSADKAKKNGQSKTVEKKATGVKNSSTNYNVNVKVEWLWSNSGKTVDGKFVQLVEDLDQTEDGEAWQARSKGAWSDFFRFKGTTVKESNGKDGVMFSATSTKTLNDNSNKGGSNDSLYKGGIYAVKNGGSGWGTFYGANCSTQVSFAPVAYPDTTEKKATVSSVDVGQTFNWEVTRRMPEFYKDTLAYFSKCVFYDNLDPKLQYVSVQVLHGNTDVTSMGTLSIRGQEVTWTANSSFLNKQTYYNGAVLRMVVSTRATAPGNVTNTARIDYLNERWSEVYREPINATINYYRDYNAGDTTPCYVDKTSNTSSGYQVNSKATAAAKRSDCSGLDGWYTDPECTKKYDGSWVPNSSDYVLNLYSKNKVALSYAATSDSWFNKHPDRSVFADKALTDKLTDRASGKTASGKSIFPASKEAYYGDVVTVDTAKSLWFKSEMFGSGDEAVRELKCSDGVYAYQDGSGDLLKEVRLTSNSTAYFKWLAGSYDGVYAAG